jgi:hypothetical protein
MKTPTQANVPFDSNWQARKPQGTAKVEGQVRFLEDHLEEAGQAHFAPKTPQNEPAPDSSWMGS